MKAADGTTGVETIRTTTKDSDLYSKSSFNPLCMRLYTGCILVTDTDEMFTFFL